MSPGVAVLAGAVRAYQWTVRPLIGANCRFHPGCSDYAVEALRVHGVLRGGGMAALRVLRCNPWHPGGYDPVPPAPAQPVAPAPPQVVAPAPAKPVAPAPAPPQVVAPAASQATAPPPMVCDVPAPSGVGTPISSEPTLPPPPAPLPRGMGRQGEVKGLGIS